MRASPALQFTLERFGVWRVAVSMLAVLSAACVVAWGATRPDGPSAWTLAVTVAALISIVACGVSVGRVAPVRCSFDGQSWRLESPPAADASNDVRTPCTLNVALDVGGWMLLRFVSQAPPPAASTAMHATWLPVQRRGLEAEWHALRCAVYAPRMPAAGDAQAESRGPE